MKNTLLLLLVLATAACGRKSSVATPNPNPLPIPPGQCEDPEPNNTIDEATFVQVLEPPDHITFCATLESNGADWYRFFASQDELISFVILSDANLPMEAFLYSRNLQNDTDTQLGHWIGNNTQLVVLNFPAMIDDDGFYLKILSPVATAQSRTYQLEIWSPGFVK